MFADVEAMKKNMKASMDKPVYNVHDFYWETGLSQRIAKHPIFENLTLAVISINAFWIAYDTDNNTATVPTEAETQFQVAEQVFCIYFTFEWTVRFFAFKKKRNGLKDGWFVFDSALVFMMVMETWVMTIIMLIMGGGGSGMGGAGILRLFRLLRLSRMARMLRSMPELMILIKGMVSACRSVVFTLVLLVLVMYVFGIAFVQLSENTEMGKVLFSTVGRAMYTLLVTGTFLDNLGYVSDMILDESPVCVVLFYLFILLAACTVMNMLIGVLCEVVSAVAQVERESMTIDFVKDTLQKVLGDADENGDGNISKDEFQGLLESPKALLALKEVDVDPLSLIDFTDYIFEDDGEPVKLSFGEFMEMVLQLRGTNTTTVKDMVELRRFIRAGFSRIEECIASPRGIPSTRMSLRSNGNSNDRPQSRDSNGSVGREMSNGSLSMNGDSAATLTDLRVRVTRMEATMHTLLQEVRNLSERVQDNAEISPSYPDGRIPRSPFNNGNL